MLGAPDEGQMHPRGLGGRQTCEEGLRGEAAKGAIINGCDSGPPWHRAQ